MEILSAGGGVPSGGLFAEAVFVGAVPPLKHLWRNASTRNGERHRIIVFPAGGYFCLFYGSIRLFGSGKC